MNYEQLMGENHRTYIIAEMSANHAGSLEYAKELIHAAKESGADCIKIQTYTADTLTINCDKPWFHIKNGTWSGENLYQLYQKAYTPWDWQGKLMEEAKKTGIDFFSTPFDRSAVDFLEKLGVEFYKIASFELVDLPLIEYAASKGKPMIISTGMGSVEEIEEAVRAVQNTGNQSIALLKCSSVYPALTENMNLLTLADMKKRFGFPVGLSDHSMGALSAVTAVALGASIIEKHFCLDRSITSPDSSFSINPLEFSQMVQGIREVESAMGQVKYGPTKQEEESVIFRKSIFAVQDIKEGERITSENIRVIRPGYGLAPKYYYGLLGKRALRDMEAGTPLKMGWIGD